MLKNKESILIVDDVTENLNILASLLKPYAKIQVARSGFQSLEILFKSSVKPALILLDILMPEMSGFETLERIRQVSGCEEIPVIFISAADDLDSKIKGFSLGAMDYITKPFEPEEVLARVKTHLALVKAKKLREDVERLMLHDLKSPINAIIATSQFELEESELPEFQKESFDIIYKSARNLEAMIDISLDLFKMEMGVFKAENMEFTLEGLFEDLYHEIHPQLNSADLSVVFNPSLQELNYTLSSVRILCYSILSNLIKNAMEAAPRDTQIEISVESIDEGVEIKIMNQGEVPREIRSNLFQKYQTSSKSSGTGLGLYSVKLIADNLGFQINCNLETAGYTQFILSIPQTTTLTAKEW